MMNDRKVLLAEDDPNLGQLLHEYLEAKGYHCTLATDGVKGKEAFDQDSFDFIILDVMMPNKDGFTLAKEIREKNDRVPILFLTAKSMKEDTLEGFEVGADDYMTKPFSMEELLARMQAILKRTEGTSDKPQSKDEYRVGEFRFRPETRQLSGLGKEHVLTTKESELLRMLVEADGVLERNEALKEVWGDDSYFNGRSMDVYITKLRKYLRPDKKIEILNVHGRGFKLITQS